MKAIEIRRLSREDDRSQFSCGQDDLDRFFEHYAGQNQFRLHLAVTYVAFAKKKIIGFEITGRGIARSHYPVYVGEKKLSEVTSGTFSPYLKKSIGLTYLPVEFTEPGTEISIDIRGKLIPAKVIPLPFYKRVKD